MQVHKVNADKTIHSMKHTDDKKQKPIDSRSRKQARDNKRAF